MSRPIQTVRMLVTRAVVLIPATLVPWSVLFFVFLADCLQERTKATCWSSLTVFWWYYLLVIMLGVGGYSGGGMARGQGPTV